MSGEPSEPPKSGYKPRFRIQQAILILREGKSHPAWREAAWHLIERAGKDTQLLLEAQRDLLLAAQPKPSFWQQYGVFLVLSILGITCLSFAFWVYINKLYCS